MAVPEKWRPRLSAPWLALAALLAYGVANLLRAGQLQFYFGLLALIFAFVVAVGLVGSLRRRLLWRLRNRLLFAYLFIAVIPIMLILGMVLLSAYLLYGQLAGYLIASDLQAKAVELGAINVSARAVLAGLSPAERASPAAVRTWLERESLGARSAFPGLVLVLASGERTVAITGLPESSAPDSGGVSAPGCLIPPAWKLESFRGVVVSGNDLFLYSAASVPGWPGATLCLTVPVNDALLADVGRDLGPYTLHLLEEVEAGSERGRIRIGQQLYASVGRVEAAGRALPPPRYFLDPAINMVSKFDIVQWDLAAPAPRTVPVFLSFTTRPSLLNQRIFAPLGEVAQVFLAVLVVSGIVFLILQVLSVITGVRLSRRITAATHDLYTATQRMQAGDFSFRVPAQHKDQLGALGESFNQMAASIEILIRESREKQRLQDELEIARQVQEQLFPREAPELRSLELVGLCQPARVVSGDYYDYGLAGAGKLILTIGDISGKGISAALLMATIQSILRTLIYASPAGGGASQLTGQLDQLDAAELASRVNRQLCATTSAEKYSTLFVGVYDDNKRQLTYTNAGHLPPVRIRRGRAEPLSVGGPVVGLFRDLHFEQATVELEPGDWLVAYTDGLTEVENTYEEEYGAERLVAFLERTADHTTPAQLIEALLAELAAWAPGAEQSDDRTLLVARAR